MRMERGLFLLNTLNVGEQLNLHLSLALTAPPSKLQVAGSFTN